MSAPSPARDEIRNGMPFLGGRLWLDLLNTTPSDGVKIHDLIDTTTGFLAWLDAADLKEPHEADQAVTAARTLRALLREAFEALSAGQGADVALVRQINSLLDDVSIRLRLEMEPGGLSLGQRFEQGSSGPASVIAADFAAFVCDFEPERLKHCANPACTIVFYDQGKNNSRRWCSMAICGNRHKVAHYRARKREG